MLCLRVGSFQFKFTGFRGRRLGVSTLFGSRFGGKGFGSACKSDEV